MITTLEAAPIVAGALGISGVGVLASRRRDMIARWCTWAVTAPLVGGALLLGRPGAAVLAGGIGVGCVAEYGRLVRLPAADRIALGIAVAVLPVVAWLAPAALLGTAVLAGIALFAVPVLAGDAEDGARRSAYAIMGLFWIGGLAGLVTLGSAALPLIFAVSLADVGAFCFGKLLRGPFLSPLSPAKRWSGAVYGAALGICALALFGAFTPALAVAVAVAAPLGDLMESMVKRGAGVKDAGSWLPGFGGLLDRVDSLLVAAAVAAVLTGTAPFAEALSS